MLSRHFLAEFHTNQAVGFSVDALETLRAHPWPGNVRELMGRVRRAAVTAEQGEIRPGDLGFARMDRRRHRRAGTGAATLTDGADAPVDPQPAEAASAEAGASSHVRFSLVRDALPTTLAAAKRDLEAWMLRASLDSSGNNVTLAAERLGVSRVTLYRLLERHGVRYEKIG